VQVVLKELCLLIGAISGSPRVNFVRINYGQGDVEILASSLGPPKIHDSSFALNIVNTKRPIILFESLKNVSEITDHPILQTIPNLHSLAAYLIQDTTQFKTMLIAWNPSPDFFSNDINTAMVERLVGLATCVFFAQSPSSEVLSSFEQNTSVALGFAEEIAVNSEPLSKFLFDTLIIKKRLLARSGASYVALRQWRKPIKHYQVKALQALKSNEAPSSLDAIAQEIIAQVGSVYGKLFTTVVPIPGGSSGRKKSFSVLIAERVAQGLNIPCHDILISSPVQKGASHPKKSMTLQPYTLKQDVTGNVLIVDDVASSGKHIELATAAIKQHANYCTAVVWIAD
jgi:predicted amidophosphoribosyltransferase